jgi:hypothetical protein
MGPVAAGRLEGINAVLAAARFYRAAVAQADRDVRGVWAANADRVPAGEVEQ